MKREARPLPPERPRECLECTTPTRCGSIGDGKRGPRCAGRADGPDSCDCLNWCGDDPWLKDGRAVPCSKHQGSSP